MPFDVWVSNVIGEAEFLANRDLVRKSWVFREGNMSWHDFDEVCEVLLEGNQPGQHLMVYGARFSHLQRDALAHFIQTFVDTDYKITNGDPRKSVDSSSLFHSDLWPPLEEAAKAVVKAFEGWEPPEQEQ